jgi:hypothetical protein
MSGKVSISRNQLLVLFNCNEAGPATLAGGLICWVGTTQDANGQPSAA